MSDVTAGPRRIAVAVLNAEIESDDPTRERARLESKHGTVYDSKELQAEYEVVGFLAPFVEVVRKCDGARGTLGFQHHPRFYFNFVEGE